MLGEPVVSGALFYGKTRRRKDVVFDDVLRSLTRRTIDDTRAMMLSRSTPTAVYDSQRCDACSLIDLCQPRWLARGKSVYLWLSKQLED
jgi:CRISPR-associated exonuclease Cas4